MCMPWRVFCGVRLHRQLLESSKLGQNLDQESAWRLNIKRPGMTPFRGLHFKSVVFQALIDLVNALLAFLDKADMKCAWIAHLM